MRWSATGGHSGSTRAGRSVADTAGNGKGLRIGSRAKKDRRQVDKIHTYKKGVLPPVLGGINRSRVPSCSRTRGDPELTESNPNDHYQCATIKKPSDDCQQTLGNTHSWTRHPCDGRGRKWTNWTPIKKKLRAYTWHGRSGRGRFSCKPTQRAVRGPDRESDGLFAVSFIKFGTWRRFPISACWGLPKWSRKPG